MNKFKFVLRCVAMGLAFSSLVVVITFPSSFLSPPYDRFGSFLSLFIVATVASYLNEVKR